MAFKLRKPPRLTTRHQAYPYQLDAVQAVRDLPYAAIFHEQGLGKTKIAVDLMLFWLVEDLVDTVFVVTKKTLVQNWTDEIGAHSFVTPRVLSGNRRQNSIALNSPVLIYIMNYEVISANLDLVAAFLRTCRTAVILDESQKIKNPKSHLTECFLSIAPDFTRRIIMTGTPVANRPFDIWSQIAFLDEGKALGSSFEEFRIGLDLPKPPPTRLESPELLRVGREEPGYASRLGAVFEKIKDFCVRETKQSAGLELPDKTILTCSVELAPEQAQIYASYRDNLSYALQGFGGSTIDEAPDLLKRLLRLVQCASNPFLLDESYQEQPGKFTRLLELLQEIEVRRKKVIIWSSFVGNVEWLTQRLQHLGPERIHGQLPIVTRNESIRRFKTDGSCRVLLATPGAAKEGLTLTVASHAIFFDRSFSLDDYLQAQDRIHRISQEEDCFVYNLIAKGTIDEWVDSLLHAKFQAAQLTQGDISEEEFEARFIADLSEELGQVLSPSSRNTLP